MSQASLITDDPPPPYLDCPDDSILVKGSCICQDNCPLPAPCSRILNRITNATDIPGQCCPQYSCDICDNSEKIDGVCPCPPETQMGKSGLCECTDPHKSLENGMCVCDEMKCELPHLCDEHSVAIKEMVGCCVNIVCKECPDDSYKDPHKDEEIEDKCVCFRCPEIACEDNMYPIVLARGKIKK